MPSLGTPLSLNVKMYIFHMIFFIHCLLRTSLFVGFHKGIVYAVDCFSDEGVFNMDVSS